MAKEYAIPTAESERVRFSLCSWDPPGSPDASPSSVLAQPSMRLRVSQQRRMMVEPECSYLVLNDQKQLTKCRFDGICDFAINQYESVIEVRV